MANRATHWVENHVDTWNRWIRKTYWDKVSDPVHKFFEPAFPWLAARFEHGSDRIDKVEDWTSKKLDKVWDKLPHPKERWAELKKRETPLGRLAAFVDPQLLALASCKRSGQATVILGHIVNWTLTTAGQIALWLAHAVSSLTVTAVRTGILATPFTLNVASRTATRLGEFGATCILEAPATARKLAFLPKKWISKAVDFVVHGAGAARTAATPAAEARAVAAPATPSAPEAAAVAQPAVAEAPAPVAAPASFTRSVTKARPVVPAASFAGTAAPAAEAAPSPAVTRPVEAPKTALCL